MSRNRKHKRAELPAGAGALEQPVQRKRRFGDRSDGYRLRSLQPMSKVSPYIMPDRSGASVYFHDSFEITEVKNYIRKKRNQGLNGFGMKLMRGQAGHQVLGRSRGTRSLVKCLVCGAIFDSSMDTCPVCGVGSDKFVPVEDTSTDFRKDTEERFVILGGGPGAHFAAEAVRARNATAKIQIITAESHLPCNRPMLTKNLEEIRSNPDGLAIHDRAWYEEKRIEIHTGTSVRRVDTENRQVITENGECHAYDKLIWAAGAECFVPPFAGGDKAGVLTIRHLKDVQNLLRLLALHIRSARRRKKGTTT